MGNKVSIAVGDVWKARGGDLVEIIHHEPALTEGPFTGIRSWKGNMGGLPSSYSADGTCYRTSGSAPAKSWDLVQKVSPKKTFWAVLYDTGRVEIYSCKQDLAHCPWALGQSEISEGRFDE